MKVSEKKEYRTYGKTEAIQDLIKSVGSNGINNDQYVEYCELKGFLHPNRKSRKTKTIIGVY